MSHPYRRFVDDLVALQRAGRALPLGGLASVAKLAKPARPAPAGVGTALLLAPHPDDECITGALPLRLQRQAGLKVVAVPVTLGSLQARRAGRLAEATAACAFLGFELQLAAPGGLERIGAATRSQDPPHWQAAVRAVADLIGRVLPDVVFFPHAEDWNSTHVGTHLLALDALAAQAPGFTCWTAETEYWANMRAPNLMVESTPEDVADLVAAVSCYAGEVQRNPFHLRLPPWMQDNVRRGGEVVGGQGGHAPAFDFATLYRLGRWQNGHLDPVTGAGRLLAAADDPTALLQPSG